MTDRSRKSRKVKNVEDEHKEEPTEKVEEKVKEISDIKNALLADVKDDIQLSTGSNLSSARIIEQQIEIPKEPERLPEIIKDSTQPVVLTKQDEKEWQDVSAEQLEQMDKEIKEHELQNEQKEVSNGEIVNIGRLFGLNMMFLKTADNIYSNRRKAGVKTLSERLLDRKEEVLESYLGIVRKYPDSFIVKLLCDPVGNLALSNFMIFEEFKLENNRAN